jgi:hypothetical protein
MDLENYSSCRSSMRARNTIKTGDAIMDSENYNLYIQLKYRRYYGNVVKIYKTSLLKQNYFLTIKTLHSLYLHM